MTKILQGQLAAMFAFDIGYEVDLDKLGTLRATTPMQPISRKKHTPPYLQYTSPPRIVTLDPVAGPSGREGMVQVVFFSFGAVSFSYRWPIVEEDRLDLERLPLLGQQLGELNLEVDARLRIDRLVSEVGAAIVRPAISPLVEDYYLFILQRLEPSITAEEFIELHGRTLAQTLRFDTIPLSRTHVEEAISQRISYYENDLVLIDWNASIIIDRDFEDTVNVLELLNVELLEARYIDALLDGRIAGFSELARRRMEFPIPFRRPYKKAMREMAELRLESVLLSERVQNALKLVGDLYLARVHDAALRRFDLREWDQMIDRKLEIVTGLYELLSDRVYTVQSQTLEMIIVLLILVELFVAFT